MDETDFKILRILSETHNITKTSERVFTTQPAISKRIKMIEDELGSPILLRSRHGVRFTAEGETVLNRVLRAEKEMQALRAEIASASGKVAGTLRACFSVNFAVCVLPDVLSVYHQKYPDVKLQISTGLSSALFRRFQADEFDIAVMRGDFSWDGISRVLCEEKICFVCSAENEGLPLSSYSYIQHDTDSSLSAKTNQWISENKIAVNDTEFCADSILTCIELVKRGIGWSILPEIVLKDFDGVKKPLRLKNGEILTRRTVLLSTEDAFCLPQVRAFADELSAHYAQN